MTPPEKTTRTGVMGWPAAHSRSPLLHGYWQKQHGIKGEYVALSVAPKDFIRALAELPEQGFSGVNITAPHKQAALGAITSAGGAVAEMAQRTGAVNTVIFHAAGPMEGRNTDVFGFMENLKEKAPQWNSAGPVAVLGAGGVARAICAGLQEAGAGEIRIVSRKEKGARGLTQEVAQAAGPSATSVSWEDREAALVDISLLVNGTPLGMSSSPPLDLALDLLPETAVVYDTVYAPLETDLLQRARARGNPAVDGLGMLIHQARHAFEAWFGVMPKATPELREILEADLRKRGAT
jgi:shikimate dehydrogenase